MKSFSQLRAVLLGLGVLALLFLINTWAFRHFADLSYVRWYLLHGSFIALGSSFLALIWEGLALRNELLSAHPAKYLRACAELLSILSHEISVNLSNPLVKASDELGTASIVATLFDSIASTLILLAILIVVIAWQFVIAPLNYILTLFSGAVARQHWRAGALRAIVIQHPSGLELTAQSTESELPEDAVDVTITRNPFALTQAINALILWAAGTALPA